MIDCVFGIDKLLEENVVSFSIDWMVHESDIQSSAAMSLEEQLISKLCSANIYNFFVLGQVKVHGYFFHSGLVMCYYLLPCFIRLNIKIATHNKAWNYICNLEM